VRERGGRSEAAHAWLRRRRRDSAPRAKTLNRASHRYRRPMALWSLEARPKRAVWGARVMRGAMIQRREAGNQRRAGGSGGQEKKGGGGWEGGRVGKKKVCPPRVFVNWGFLKLCERRDGRMGV